MNRPITTDQLSGKLRFVELLRSKLNLERFPDFLIVGPQRTGTSWLTKRLARHPEIFISEHKEPRFLDPPNNDGEQKYGAGDLVEYLRLFRDNPWSYARKMTAALARYGIPYAPLVRGDAAPGFAVLVPELIREIVMLNPDIKVILMVRNPVARAWSHAKKDLASRRRRRVSEVSEEEFQSFFQNRYQQACGRYTTMISNWSQQLQDGNFYLGLFDDIRDRQEDLLRRVFAFLGVSSDPRFARQSEVRINSTENADVPEIHRILLERLFDDELKALDEMYGLSWRAQQS